MLETVTKSSVKSGKTAIFTISAANYFAFARTLLRSVRGVHDDVDLYYLLADEISDVEQYCEPGVYEVVTVGEVGIPDYRKLAFVYNLVEFNTAIKPYFIQYLFAKGYDKVIYLDPDILVLSRLDDAISCLESHAIIVTPHQLAPLENVDGFRRDMTWETAALGTGIFNLGFVGVARNLEGGTFLDWWINRCHFFCFADSSSVLFFDQKWMNLAPCYFSSLHILRHRGYNMSVWNLHERRLTNGLVNGKEPLVFYHFSSFDMAETGVVSRHNPKVDMRDDLVELFARYRATLIDNGYERFGKTPYAFGRFYNGETINPVTRKLFTHIFKSALDPYSHSNRSFLKAARVEYSKLNQAPGVSEGGLKGATKWIFRLFLRVFGGQAYLSLISTMGTMVNIRNHSFLLR